jgi:hypothetical protein
LNCRIALRCAVSILVLTSQSFAEPVAVHYAQGTVHGFLTIRSAAGVILGYGESVQTVAGDRVTLHNTFHFRDGSLDDETAVFTQHNVFQFVSDHHLQRGPFFKNATDSNVDASGQVTVKTTGNDGKVKEETTHIDLPADTANGIVAPLLLNLPPGAAGLTLGMVIPNGKGRLIKLNVTPDGTAPFTAVAGAPRKATLFRIRLELGGIAGVVAPMVGKQPSDIIIWVLEGDAPAFVREVGQLSEGGPIVSIELAGTSFPHAR